MGHSEGLGDINHSSLSALFDEVIDYLNVVLRELSGSGCAGSSVLLRRHSSAGSTPCFNFITLGGSGYRHVTASHAIILDPTIDILIRL
jgi:hypothetical protein